MIRSSGLLIPDLLPVDVREGVVSQRLAHSPLDEIGCAVRLGGKGVFGSSKKQNPAGLFRRGFI
jgi:hypothetical protein